MIRLGQLAAPAMASRLLHELLAAASGFGVLVNPKTPAVVEPFIKQVQTAAATIGRQIEVLTATTNRDIDTVFTSLVAKKVDALLVSPDLYSTTVASNSSH